MYFLSLLLIFKDKGEKMLFVLIQFLTLYNLTGVQGLF